MRIPPEPRSAPPPPTLLRIASAAVTSPRAPPIAVRPRPISSQFIPLNLARASANISHALAIAIMATALLRLVLPTLLMPYKPPTSIPIPTPRATSPLPISVSFMPSSFLIALAIIFKASAIAIIAIPALIIPLGLYLESVFAIDAKLRFNPTIIAPMAPRDLPISLPSSEASLAIESVRTPIAAAIVKSVPA